jgi:hypothetical protein
LPHVTLGLGKRRTVLEKVGLSLRHLPTWPADRDIMRDRWYSFAVRIFFFLNIPGRSYGVQIVGPEFLYKVYHFGERTCRGR